MRSPPRPRSIPMRRHRRRATRSSQSVAQLGFATLARRASAPAGTSCGLLQLNPARAPTSATARKLQELIARLLRSQHPRIWKVRGLDPPNPTAGKSSSIGWMGARWLQLLRTQHALTAARALPLLTLAARRIDAASPPG